MVESIRFDIVADIYDTYVNTMIDIPFFLHETENVSGKIYFMIWFLRKKGE
jgi:hypothetical protein